MKIAIPWAIEGLVPAYGISLIQADPKMGKSILSVQLCHALANNLPLFGYKPSRAWKMLYVQADEPATEWAHQLEALGISDESWDTTHLPPGALTLPNIVEDLKLACRDYEFVVFDSLISLFGYPDIKSASVAGYLLNIIRSFYDGPTWIIHHKRKRTAGVPDSPYMAGAGSFALAAGVSTIYDLAPRRLNAFGRVVSIKLNLLRATNGLWVVDSRERLE